jgi:beta-barrel assembly-enhancing protease
VGAVLLLGFGLNFGAGRMAAALLPWIPLSVDQRLGDAFAVEVPGFTTRCDDPGPEKYVQQLARPLIEALGPNPFDFRFRVVPDRAPNAFAAPGGYVTVHFGLLTSAKNGDEVALVLAHELEHVVLRHATARALRNMSGIFLFSFLLGGSALGSWVDRFDDVFARSYDRAEEAEADLAGARLAARTGIDPKAFRSFLARLPKGGPDALTWLGDHPANEERILALEDVPFDGPRREVPAPVGLHCSREGDASP